MKLLKHLATFGGVYLFYIAIYAGIFWCIPLAIVDFKFFPWSGIAIVHAVAVITAWASLGFSRIP